MGDIWVDVGVITINGNSGSALGSMDPNADPEFPFIVITPTSTQMSPINQPAGIDWDIFESAANDDNREAMLFESIIGCLDSQYEIDTRRIYTPGIDLILAV